MCGVCVVCVWCVCVCVVWCGVCVFVCVVVWCLWSVCVCVCVRDGCEWELPDTMGGYRRVVQGLLRGGVDDKRGHLFGIGVDIV